MKCIYCNTPLGTFDYCKGCGADISTLKRIGRISNLLYNEGLEKARIRDMEGAITCLKRSLKFSKENTAARNLLGLCYYETGEAVSALCEWVISKNLQPEDNLADGYINALQNNKNKLDTVNQSIRKYNQSVLYCREDNEDMAIIQLKKVLSRNPKLVKAYQLLALLYMKRQENERARKLLKKALQIDTTNTTTLRYLQEIDAAGSRHRPKKEEPAEGVNPISGSLRYMSGNELIVQPTTFRDSSAIATFINIILGILLGGAIVWFLIVPANKQNINNAANKTVTEANTKLASVQLQVEELQEEIASYDALIEEAEQNRDAALSKADGYDELMAIANLYISGSETQAASRLSSINKSELEDNALALYETIHSAVAASLFSQYYTAGTTAYVQKDYATAAAQLALAVEADSDRTQANHVNALIYLGMAYYYQGDRTSADAAFAQIVEYFPSYASQISGYMSSSATTTDNSNTIDLSGLGDAATGADAIEDTGTADEDIVTIYE